MRAMRSLNEAGCDVLEFFPGGRGTKDALAAVSRAFWNSLLAARSNSLGGGFGDPDGIRIMVRNTSADRSKKLSQIFQMARIRGTHDLEEAGTEDQMTRVQRHHARRTSANCQACSRALTTT